MSHERADAVIRWMLSKRTIGEKAGLDNMRALMRALGHPEKSLKAVHVAGTNGKGSVSAFIERALRACGHKTGLYTSPYLTVYNERMRIAGAPISDEALASAGERLVRAAEAIERDGAKPTTFELGTALMFLAFQAAGVDIAVIEAGIGGRSDATNVVTPEVSVICTIGLDHMALLGDTLASIARDKAGILKQGVPAAFYPHEESARAVLMAAARAVHCPVRLAEDYPMAQLMVDARGSSFEIDLPTLGAMDIRIDLPGAHQAQNARLALVALSELAERGFDLNPRDVERGMKATVWPGRLEWIEADILLDGAHNPQGARALAGYLRRFFPDREIILVTGMMSDKQPDAYALALAPVISRVIATRVDWARAMPPEELAALYRAQGVPAEACAAPANALARARALQADGALLLVAGSLYLVGEVRALLLGDG